MPGKNKGIADETPIAGKRKAATFSGIAIKESNAPLKDTTVLVCLSIKGNPHCVGEDLQAIIEHALTTHKNTTFLIGDETHWHNLKSHSDVSETEELALKRSAIALGSDYLEKNLPVFFAVIKQIRPDVDMSSFIERNQSKSPSDQTTALNEYAEQFKVPFQIVRWHEWIANGNHGFFSKQRVISTLYESETVLKDSLVATTRDFVLRHKNDAEKIGHELFSQRSYDYLKEETPAIFWVAAALGINFVAYPGKAPKLFHETKNFFITKPDVIEHASLRVQVDQPELLANWLEIKIKTTSKTKSPAQPELPANGFLPSQSIFAQPKPLQRSQSYNLDVKSEWVNAQTQLIIYPQQENSLVADSMDQADDESIEEDIEEQHGLLTQLLTFIRNVPSKDKMHVATLLVTYASELLNRPATPCKESTSIAAGSGGV